MHFILQSILPLNPQEWNGSSDLCSGCCSAGPLVRFLPKWRQFSTNPPALCPQSLLSSDFSSLSPKAYIFQFYGHTTLSVPSSPHSLAKAWQRRWVLPCAHQSVNGSVGSEHFFFVKLSKIISSHVFPFHPSLGGWSKPPRFNVGIRNPI